MKGSVEYRKISPEDDADIARIARYNLKKHGLDLPGTVYFDDNLNHLSDFYLADGYRRFYYVLTDNGKVVGGVVHATMNTFFIKELS